MRRQLLLATALMLMAVAVAGCGWQPYPHNSSSPAPSTGKHHTNQCSGKVAQVECLLGQIRPTTDRAELRRIFRQLRRLHVHCTGTTVNGISCTGPGSAEGWELGFATTGQMSG